MEMPGRKSNSGNYRFGFQGQEVDSEIKGEGNSVNYKYRMHDPRLGRFFAVDPLAVKYPHNSTYAFSENSTIAFIELEGLEKYFAADGSVLGTIGKNTEIRIVCEEDCRAFQQFFNNKIDNETPQFFSNSLRFSEAGEDVQKAVASTIYNEELGLRPEKITIDEADKGTAASMSSLGFYLTVYPNMTEGYELLLNDYYNFVHVLVHEDDHRKGNGGRPFEHVEAEISAINHSSFSKMTDNGREFSKGVYRGYLKYDMGGYLAGKIFGAETKDYAETIFNSSNFQYYYKYYLEKIKTYNELFNEDYKPIDFEKMINSKP